MTNETTMEVKMGYEQMIQAAAEWKLTNTEIASGYELAISEIFGIDYDEVNHAANRKAIEIKNSR